MEKFRQEGHPAIIMVKTSANNENSPIENEIPVKRINFLYIFRPIYYFSRISGLMPFSITYGANGEVQRPKITILDGIWFVISIFVNSLQVYLTLRVMFVKQTSPTFVMILGNTFLLMTTIYGVGAVAMDMCNRFKFIEILKSLAIFDNQVSGLFLKTFFIF